MAERGDWANLICDCGSDRFFPLLALRWKQGGGVTNQSSGYWCAECHAVVNTGHLIERAMVRAKRAELATLEAEIAEGLPQERT